MANASDLHRRLRQSADVRTDREAVAFVFPGGGGLAATQIGMLRALTEAGIVPDLVIGASAGALNAVAFASQPSPAGLAGLEALWTTLQRKDVFPISLRRSLAAVTGHGDGLFSQGALRELLESCLMAPRLEQTPVPAHVVVTDHTTGQPVVLSEGNAVSALLATSAFPGIFPPVMIDDRPYIDGGVAANTPILQAEALGATVSYVLPAAAAAERVPSHRGVLPLAFRALSQLLDNASVAGIAAACGSVHVLPAPRTATPNPLVFSETARLIDDGYRLANEWLRHQASAAA